MPSSQTQARRYKVVLKELTSEVTKALRALDAAMKEPESVERGRRIAGIANALEMVNDSVHYFSLGVDWRTDKKTEPTRVTDGSVMQSASPSHDPDKLRHKS